jgi:hypothetical protein
MADRVEFEVSCRPATLDHYRRDWRPDPGQGLAGMWFGAVVRDAAGQDYWGLRGADDMIPGMTHVVAPIVGFRKLQKGLDAEAPHLFSEYSSIDWFEPLQYSDTPDRVVLSYASGRIERDHDGCHWYDAAGRWEMHGKTVSDVFVVHVPAQTGIDHDVYYRHELLTVHGRIDGVEVSGYAHQDYAYGPPGMLYTELPIARKLQGMWVSWLHENHDGTVGGGCFWQGRDGLSFGPGYQLVDGTTTAHADIEATPSFNDAGRLTALQARIGSQHYTFAFDTSGSPLHVFGPLTAGPDGAEPGRSWCWVEYAGGMLTPEILDLVAEQYRLARGL